MPKNRIPNNVDSGNDSKVVERVISYLFSVYFVQIQ